MNEGWREKALAEIRSIKPHWAAKYEWGPEVKEQDDRIDVYAHFTQRSKKAGGSSEKTGDSPGKPKRFVLRLRYKSDFETAGRLEAFVNPENLEEEGSQYWPSGVSGFNPTGSPPSICLEGTWGFHSFHHRERDGRRANLNKLLMEIQKCLNQ